MCYLFGAGVGTDDDPLIASLLCSNSQINSKVKLVIDVLSKKYEIPISPALRYGQNLIFNYL